MYHILVCMARGFDKAFGKTKIAHWLLVRSGQKRCSGWRVYPGGQKCPGCSDCNYGKIEK